MTLANSKPAISSLKRRTHSQGSNGKKGPAASSEPKGAGRSQASHNPPRFTTKSVTRTTPSPTRVPWRLEKSEDNDPNPGNKCCRCKSRECSTRPQGSYPPIERRMPGSVRSNPRTVQAQKQDVTWRGGRAYLRWFGGIENRRLVSVKGGTS